MAELIKLFIKCMDEKEEFYLEETGQCWHHPEWHSFPASHLFHSISQSAITVRGQLSWKIKKFRTTGGIYGSTKELSTYDKLKGKQSVLLGMAVY